MGTSTAFAITSRDLLDWQLGLINQLSVYTLAYLGVAVAVVLALGGAFYLFTLRPFEKELERQAGEIKDAKENLRQAFETQLNQIRAVETKISGLEVTQANNGKDIESAKSREKIIEGKFKDTDLRLREIETRNYSQEGKMGSILIPLRTIKELVGTANEWRIPPWLDTLKKEITGANLSAETKIQITESLSSLPSKYQIPKDEILKLIAK